MTRAAVPVPWARFGLRRLVESVAMIALGLACGRWLIGGLDPRPLPPSVTAAVPLLAILAVALFLDRRFRRLRRSRRGTRTTFS